MSRRYSNTVKGKFLATFSSWWISMTHRWPTTSINSVLVPVKISFLLPIFLQIKLQPWLSASTGSRWKWSLRSMAIFLSKHETKHTCACRKRISAYKTPQILPKTHSPPLPWLPSAVFPTYLAFLMICMRRNCPDPPFRCWNQLKKNHCRLQRWP